MIFNFCTYINSEPTKSRGKSPKTVRIKPDFEHMNKQTGTIL